MIAQRYKDMLSGKSVIRQISEWSTARGTEIGYENVFDYSLGNPSVPCPEHFTKTCIDLLQTKEPVTLHGYSPTLTIPAVRKAVAESLNRRFGMDYGMEHIFMATGAAGALAHAMRCVAVPGQDIITFAPFFPEYKPYVEGAGLNLKVVPPRTKDFQIDFDAFDAMLDENTAAVLINTPNNPSGAAYSAETLKHRTDFVKLHMGINTFELFTQYIGNLAYFNIFRHYTILLFLSINCCFTRFNCVAMLASSR